MKTMMKKIPALLMLVMMLFAFSVPAYAAESDQDMIAIVEETEDTIDSAENVIGDKAQAAALV